MTIKLQNKDAYVSFEKKQSAILAIVNTSGEWANGHKVKVVWGDMPSLKRKARSLMYLPDTIYYITYLLLKHSIKHPTKFLLITFAHKLE